MIVCPVCETPPEDLPVKRCECGRLRVTHPYRGFVWEFRISPVGFLVQDGGSRTDDAAVRTAVRLAILDDVMRS